MGRTPNCFSPTDSCTTEWAPPPPPCPGRINVTFIRAPSYRLVKRAQPVAQMRQRSCVAETPAQRREIDVGMEVAKRLRSRLGEFRPAARPEARGFVVVDIDMI